MVECVNGNSSRVQANLAHYDNGMTARLGAAVPAAARVRRYEISHSAEARKQRIMLMTAAATRAMWDRRPDRHAVSVESDVANRRLVSGWRRLKRITCGLCGSSRRILKMTRLWYREDVSFGQRSPTCRPFRPLHCVGRMLLRRKTWAMQRSRLHVLKCAAVDRFFMKID